MMMREAITLIRQLWSEERVTFDGEYYKTDRATINTCSSNSAPTFCRAYERASANEDLGRRGCEPSRLRPQCEAFRSPPPRGVSDCPDLRK
jgi:hypothetical protein